MDKPYYRTKMCRFGATCRNLSKGTCTFAHSTEEQRVYYNAWANCKYYVVTLTNNTVLQYLSFKDKGAAAASFQEQVREDRVSGVTCKDSFLYVTMGCTALMLTGLPKQENKAVVQKILARTAQAADHTILAGHPDEPAAHTDFGETGRCAAGAGEQGVEAV